MKRLILCIAGLLAAGACIAQKSNEVAVFTKNKIDPFFEEARVGAAVAAKAFGLNVIQYAPTKPNNFQEQMAQVEDALIKRPLGFVFVPVDPKGFKPAVDKVRAAGIPIVNFIDLGEGNFSSYVIYNDRKMAADLTEVLAKELKGRGNIVIIEGIKGSSTSDNRTAGALETLKKYPGIKVLAIQPANYQRMQALQVAENLMQQHPKIDGIIAASDNMALAAVEAMEAAGRKGVLTVGMDGTIDGVNAIKAGRFFATAEFSGFQMGCSSVEVIQRLSQGQPVPPRVELLAPVITKANANQYGLPLEKRKCLSMRDLGL